MELLALNPKKFFICHSTGSVYWREGEHIAGAPIWADNSFDITESCLVEPELDESVTYKGELYSWERFYKMLERKLPLQVEKAPF